MPEGRVPVIHSRHHPVGWIMVVYDRDQRVNQGCGHATGDERWGTDKCAIRRWSRPSRSPRLPGGLVQGADVPVAQPGEDQGE